MKTTLKSITVTSIISFILYVFLMLSVFSCKTVNKTKTYEDFVSKQDLSQLDQKWSTYLQTFKKDVKETSLATVKDYLKVQKESSSTNENENSVISGKATAEEGKEKTFTAGNTTIKTNGFEIAFEINTLKQLKQSYESRIEQQDKSISNLQTALETSETIRTEEVNALTKRVEVLESEKSTQTKTVSKRTIAFCFIVVCAVSFVLFLLYKFGGRIPIVAKVKKWF